MDNQNTKIICRVNVMLGFVVEDLLSSLAGKIKVPRAITKNSIQTKLNKLTHFLKNDAVNNNLEKCFTIIIKPSSWEIYH